MQYRVSLVHDAGLLFFIMLYMYGAYWERADV